MAKLNVITYPDPLLRVESTPVERVDDELCKFADDMFETMYAHIGVGLAAIQVAVPKRMFVADTSREKDKREPILFINPEIVSFSDVPRMHEEGCLSIPDMFAELERPNSVTVRYLDKEGKQQELTAEGLLATVIQHEVDHLNGMLFIDHLSRLRRDRLVKKFLKGRKEEVL